MPPTRAAQALHEGTRTGRGEEETDTLYTYERSYGTFTRAFTLPDGVDMSAIRAEVKEDVLTLSVPKMPAAQPKKIAVQASPANKA